MYTYDSMGRLRTVTKNSTLVEEYQYNTNGTRTYEMNSLRGISGRTLTYSDGDHLLTAGTATYQYDVDGFLTTKTNGADVTAYSYSSRGELLNATLPDSTLIGKFGGHHTYLLLTINCNYPMKGYGKNSGTGDATSYHSKRGQTVTNFFF